MSVVAIEHFSYTKYNTLIMNELQYIVRKFYLLKKVN